MLSVDAQVGNYRIVRLLGQGGMGAVYLAEHLHIGRRAAVKVLHPEYSENPTFSSRFLNEARAVNLIQHPGLVEIFEYGRLEDGTAYIIMEYLEGETLRGRIARRGLLRQHALPIAYQVAEALAAAHEKSIIHRDLKPDNIMLVPDRHRRCERVKVLDFGVAKVAPQGAGPEGPKTATGTTVGTAEYMAPEQCMAREITGKTDCYSLGVVLYEMLSGRLPFEAPFSFELMRMHVYEEPRSLAALDSSLPGAWVELVKAMMVKDPEGRPRMDELLPRIAALCPSLELPLPDSGAQVSRVPEALAPTASADSVAPTAPPPAIAAPLPTPLLPPLPTQALRPPRLGLLLGLSGLGVVALGLLWLLLRPVTPLPAAPLPASPPPQAALPAPPPPPAAAPPKEEHPPREETPTRKAEEPRGKEGRAARPRPGKAPRSLAKQGKEGKQDKEVPLEAQGVRFKGLE